MRSIARLRCIAGVVAVGIVLAGCAGVRLDRETEVTDMSTDENRTQFVFPVGYEAFHENEAINFLLNRTYSMGYAPREDMETAGERITAIETVGPEMERLARAAAAENRHVNSAFYFRAAEFYTPWGDPRKEGYYDRFIEEFYLAFGEDDFELSEVPYRGTTLAAMRVPHQTPEQSGTIILHAGYDGFKEELYSAMRYLAAYGYDVINFDVPWMSGNQTSLRLGFDYEWEKIVGAVLDHYELDDVTIFGLSFGGWLALRAGAFEERITKVVASSVSFDVNQYVGRFSQWFARFARTKMPGFTNTQIVKQMESDPQSAWFFGHLMHATNKETPLEAANVLAEINEENLHSELVTQDVLILTGLDDHVVPFKMHNLQVKALVNARSVTPLVFTSEVHGQNHCQVGNLGLALSSVVNWLDNPDP